MHVENDYLVAHEIDFKTIKMSKNHYTNKHILLHCFDNVYFYYNLKL